MTISAHGVCMDKASVHTEGSNNMGRMLPQEQGTTAARSRLPDRGDRAYIVLESRGTDGNAVICVTSFIDPAESAGPATIVRFLCPHYRYRCLICSLMVQDQKQNVSEEVLLHAYQVSLSLLPYLDTVLAGGHKVILRSLSCVYEAISLGQGLYMHSLHHTAEQYSQILRSKRDPRLGAMHRFLQPLHNCSKIGNKWPRNGSEPRSPIPRVSRRS